MPIHIMSARRLSSACRRAATGLSFDMAPPLSRGPFCAAQGGAGIAQRPRLAGREQLFCAARRISSCTSCCRPPLWPEPAQSSLRRFLVVFFFLLLLFL